MANWKGTPVPNSGTIEKVYFNTNLSVEEVVSIIESSNLTLDSEGAYAVYADPSNGNSLVVARTSYMFGIGGYAILDVHSNNGFLFVSNEELKNALADNGVTNVGWQPSFSGVIEINANVDNGGNENDKLSSLFSITPFTQSEDKNILMHPRNADGTINKEVNYYPRTKVGNLLASNGSKFTMSNVTYKQGEWQGEVVPNSGTVEKVYIRTGISDEELINLFSSLTFTDNIYYVLRDKNTPSINLQVAKVTDLGENVYAIVGHPTSSETIMIYVSKEYAVALGASFEGWNPDFVSPIEFSSDVDSTYGAENDKLSTIFSINEFTQSSGGLFETNEDGTPNTEKPIQTGISEERVNELIDLKITGWLGGES